LQLCSPVRTSTANEFPVSTEWPKNSFRLKEIGTRDLNVSDREIPTTKPEELKRGLFAGVLQGCLQSRPHK